MSMAFFVSGKSKDNSSRIGAIIVSEDNAILSTGYNGLARGVKETAERNARPEKYFWYAHGERNACYNAAREGIRLKGSRIYTQGTPCADCAIAVIQSGIKECIVSSLWEGRDPQNPARQKWLESAKRSKDMFNEAGVKLIVYNAEYITHISGKFSGTDFELNEKES